MLGYLLGSCPWGYWLVLAVKHEDIRKVGSGNIGASNVWRTYGRWLGAPVVVLDTLKGFIPGRARDAVRLRRITCRASARVRRRCSATGGRSSCASPRAGRWSRPAAACSSGSRSGWRSTAGVVWLAVFLATRYASVASVVAGIALPVAAALYGYPMSVILFGVRRGRRRSSTSTGGTSAGCVPGRSTGSVCGGRPVRKALVRRRLSQRRSGSRPASLAAGWCGGSAESPTDRPDVVTGAQVHAIVATPSDPPDQFAAVANRLADDVASMTALVDRPGSDAGAALRPGDVLRRAPARTSRSCACRSRRAPIRVLRPSAPSSERSPRAGFVDPYKDYVVYYDGPAVLPDVCGTGGGSFDQGERVRGRLAERLSRTSRATASRPTSSCTPSERRSGAERLHGCDRPPAEQRASVRQPDRRPLPLCVTRA